MIATAATSVCAAAAGVTSAVSASEACVEGKRKSGGVEVLTWCGPATATVKSAGKVYSFRGGRGRTSFGIFFVSIGTNTLDGPPRHKYFSLGIPAKRDGTFDAFLDIKWHLPGRYFSLLNEKVTLTNNLTRGRFSGVLDGKPATGTFSCNG